MFVTKEDFYPLGTTVRLKDNRNIFIIIGLKPRIPGGIAADYLAVRYPCGYEGTLDSQYFFNAESIEEVLLDGYRDENFLKLAENFAKIEQIASDEAKVASQPSTPILD